MTSSGNAIGRQSSKSIARTLKNIRAYGLFGFVKPSHLNTWVGRYQNNLRTDITYKPKVEVPRFYLLMPWTIDLSISIASTTAESRSCQQIGTVRPSDVKDRCLAIEIV